MTGHDTRAAAPTVLLRAEGEVEEETLSYARTKIDAVVGRPGLPTATGEVRIARAGAHHADRPWTATAALHVGRREVVVLAEEATGREVVDQRTCPEVLDGSPVFVPCVGRFGYSDVRNRVWAVTYPLPFVALDGAPEASAGFIPPPELSWRWISSCHEAVSLGQRVTAEVLALDTEIRGQAVLSLVALQPNAWSLWADRAAALSGAGSRSWSRSGSS
ncbi:hypothetical protein [Streptomyces caniscabiei]|uniref:S1 motif domain-containing protein n=1 Tax=Streptomyces caniscabiei TaxID=2746961 RepID=A0A927L8L5_9ACTN|nr:hypothetical protein [Streptomyces caniscabiei]MBD9727495.1 hypothetical protein [Streptomyces caniscabiei]MDX3512614.1 hypothetical protein [Streptomyces caniscabiei]MDX3722139.1 hypothetical protein [Streptomyces caniscabiei]MDX3730674.1 hypothetical protein [Streptomyces caniscabiei]WEO28877.1 hypothetical protein IHE65_40060 [Streptomyces caniscabiei]